MKHIILPEIVTVGIYNAQVVWKNRLISPKRKTVMFEIELPVEDGGTSHIDDTTHPILQNTVICAKPGQLRHTRLPFKCYYVHMISNESRIFDMLSSLPNFVEIDNVEEFKKIFVSLYEHDLILRCSAVIMLVKGNKYFFKLLHVIDLYKIGKGGQHVKDP